MRKWRATATKEGIDELSHKFNFVSGIDARMALTELGKLIGTDLSAFNTGDL